MHGPITFIEHLPLDQLVAGPKAMNLARLQRAGFNVPQGFVLDYDLLDKHLVYNGVQNSILSELRRLDEMPTDEKEKIIVLSEKIRTQIRDLDLPEDMASEICRCYNTLSADQVSVRSSSSLEDSGNRAFAGQHDTYLGVKGEESLLGRVKDVWASAWSDRAVLYLKTLGISLLEVRMGVVVQKMVDAEASGVAFSVHPVTGNREHLYISAGFGLGEATVSGKITPDEIVLQKQTADILEYKTGDKNVMHTLDAEGSREVELDTVKRYEKVLSDQMVKKIGKQLVLVENCMDFNPQDIEWALSDGQLYLLQARPMFLPALEAAGISWESPLPGAHWRRNWRLGEWLPEAVTPLFASWILPVLVASREEFGTGALGWKDMESFSMPKPWFCIINGYFYTRQDFPHTLQSESLSDRMTRMNSSRQRIENWKRESLPAYISYFEQEIRNREISELSNSELVSLIDRLAAEAGEFWSFIAPIGYGFEEMIFKPLYDRLVPGEKPHYSVFFSGYKSPMMEAQADLWRLARAIKSDPGLVAVIRDCDPEDTSLIDRFPDWLAEGIEKYNQVNGHQVLSLDIYWPTLGETPVHVITSLKAMVMSDIRNPEETLSEIQEARDRAVEDVLSRLSDNPEKKERFAETIAYYQTNASVREYCNFYLQAGWPLIRKAVRELADRLVKAEVILNQEQVFFMQKAELLSLLGYGHEGMNHTSISKVCEGRMSTWDRQRQLDPPDIIPFHDERTEEDEHGDILQGIGVSPGIFEGRIKVVISAEDEKAFKKGDILVIRAASPIFTPLMLLAGGLIVEVGGGASHSSLVAREIGLPAVADVRHATRIFRTGDSVVLDGSKGLVRRVELEEGR